MSPGDLPLSRSDILKFRHFSAIIIRLSELNFHISNFATTQQTIMSSERDQQEHKPIKLTPLEPTQYRLWADLAKSTLKTHKIFDIVDGSSPDPTPNGVDSDNSKLQHTLLYL